MHRLIIGCGYLGLRAARAWRSRGDRVAALTRSATRAEMLRSEGIEPVIGDVLDPVSLAGLTQLGEIDTLLYAVGYDRASQASRQEIYVNGLSNVLSALRGQVRRINYISSTSVYGQDGGEQVDETSPCEPVAENGRVCLEAEQTARQHAAGADDGSSGGFALNILRLAGIYGPDRLLRRVDALRRNEPLEGNPDAWLNLIHVDDAVAAITACEERGRAGEVYLVCDDEPLPRREYYSLLASLVDAPAPRFETKTLDGQVGDELRRETRSGMNKRCSNRKLREELRVTLRFPTCSTGLPQALAESTVDGIGGKS